MFLRFYEFLLNKGQGFENTPIFAATGSMTETFWWFQ